MNRFVKLIFLAIAAVVLCTAAQAANYTNNTSGNWSVGGSWLGSVGASALDAVIVFNPSGTDNSTNDNAGAFLLNQLWVAPNQTVNLAASGGSSLLFTNNTTTMPVITNANAGTFTLNTPITLGTNLTIGVGNASGAITINSNITEVAGVSNSLTETGSGLLTLVGTNTYKGFTSVSGGTLMVNAGQITNTLYVTVGPVVGTPATLVVTNGGTVYSSAFDGSLGNAYGCNNNRIQVTGTGSRLDIGSKYLNIAYSSSSNSLIVDNHGAVYAKRLLVGTYDNAVGNSVIVTNGGSIVLQGTLNIANSNNGTNNWGYVGGNGASLSTAGNTLRVGAGVNSVSNSLFVDAGGTVSVADLHVGSGNSSLGNNMVITNGGKVTSYTYGSDIGLGNPSKSNYVVIAGGNAMWVLGNAILTIGGNANATGNYMTVSSGGILTNGSVALGGVGSKLNLYGGNAYVSNVNVTVSDAQLNFNGGTLHAIMNGNLISGAIWTNTTAASLDSVAYTVTNAIVVAGPGSLTKLGSGTMVLTSNNTYSGVTTVNQGVLNLASSGTINNSPIITVSNGATFDVSAYVPYTLTSQILAGNGVVTGSVVVADGAGVSGGATNDVGTLTFTNNLTLNSGAVVYWNYNDTTTDVVSVKGTLTLPLSGVATVNVSRASGSTTNIPSNGVLFTFGAGPADGDLSSFVITGTRANSRVVVRNKQVILVSSTGMIIEIY